jgi:hypothetical protein
MAVTGMILLNFNAFHRIDLIRLDESCIYLICHEVLECNIAGYPEITADYHSTLNFCARVHAAEFASARNIF